MLCLQDRLSTQINIADFYSTICFRLCGANVHVYCKIIYLSCVARQRSLSCHKQCHFLIATVVVGKLGKPSLLTRHELFRPITVDYSNCFERFSIKMTTATYITVTCHARITVRKMYNAIENEH